MNEQCPVCGSTKIEKIGPCNGCANCGFQIDCGYMFWNDDSTFVLGAVSDFNSKDEFIKEVKEELGKMDSALKNIKVHNVRIEPCISTEKGIPGGDRVMLLRAANVVIENYYAADVEYEY